MYRFLYTFLCLFSAIFLFSCEKEEVPAKATIVINKQILKVGEEVTIKTIGGRDIYQEWDFGNGQKGIGLENKVKYDTPGWYLVKLTTTNHHKQITEVIDTIMVGTLYCHGLTVWNMNFLDPAGLLWDNDGTGPDLEIKVGGLPPFLIVPNPANLTQRDFPIALRLMNNVPYEVTASLLTVDIAERDDSRLRPIKNWRINPYQLALHHPDAIGRQYYLSGNYPKVSIYFSLQ